MTNPNFYQQPYGYGYGVARPQAKNTQPLTPDQIQKLRQNSNAFDMKVEQEDLWRAACTHKEKNGQGTLIAQPDGTYRCTICNEVFNFSESKKEEVEEAVKVINDMLQTTKTIYVDASDTLIEQYFQIIPLLKKLPQLWERAMQNFAVYEDAYNGVVSPIGTPGYQNGFATMTNLLSNPYAAYGQQMMQPQYGYGAPQQPAYPNGGMMMQPQYGYGAPQMAPMAPAMDPMMGNPMAYGAPMAAPAPVAPAPVAPAPGVMPAAPAPATAAAPVAPATPAPATGEVQQTQTFNV